MKKGMVAGGILVFALGVVTLPWNTAGAWAADTAARDVAQVRDARAAACDVVPKTGAVTCGTASETGAITYDAAEFDTFRGRTKEEVGRRYGEAMYAGDSYVDGDRNTYYETVYSLENPYAAGKLTEDTHKTMTAMTDFYRWLVGVEPLREASVHSDKLQAEALVRNFEFNHSISDSSKPEDMEQEFWDYGAKDYIHNILARYSSPRNSITSWMNEGYIPSYGWDTVGHRYALIGATASDVQFGYAGSVAIGQEKAYKNTMGDPFSAFPAPGYMPANLVRSQSSAWSIEMDRNRVAVADRNSVVVKVTNTDTGESYECTVANGKLQASEYSSLLVFVQPVPVSGTRYSGGYQVEVAGLADVESEQPAALTYTTEFFDPTDYTPSYVKTVTADGIEKYIVYESTATTENLTKIAYGLPDEVTVVAENGRKAQVPVMGRWVLDEAGQCWTNQADASKLPSDITDRENVLGRCTISYQISDSYFDSFNSLRIIPSVPEVGDSAEMSVYLSLTSADASAIFQLVPQGDGTYVGKKKYDSRTSSGFEVTGNGNHVYKIPSLQKSDEGEYFSIFYESSGTSAYVSTQICTLTLKNGGTAGDDTQQNPGGQNGGTTGDTGKEEGNQSGGTVGDDTQQNPGGQNGGTTGDTGKKEGGSTSDDEQVGAKKVSENGAPKVAKVRKFAVSSKKKALSLTWKKVSGASGYQVQASTKKSFKGARKISVKKGKARYRISKLKPGKKYYVRIRAYRTYKTPAGKTKKVYGTWVVKSKKTKGAK